MQALAIAQVLFLSSRTSKLLFALVCNIMGGRKQRLTNQMFKNRESEKVSRFCLLPFQFLSTYNVPRNQHRVHPSCSVGVLQPHQHPRVVAQGWHA